MHKLGYWFYLSVLVCLTLGLGLVTSACSDQDRQEHLLTSTAVSLTVHNAYGLKIPQVTYNVAYNSSTGDDQTAKGTADYKVISGKGACTIAFIAEGTDIAITSIKLSNPANDIPFEWLDYDEPQAVIRGSLNLDADDNEYAGGNGSEEQPYLVGNPRQLHNVRKNCGTETCYQQIRDIDFEGSCGLMVSVSVVDHEIQYEAATQDDTARFFNGGIGWQPIGDEDAPFIGSYDGKGFTIDGVVVFAPESTIQGLFARCGSCTFSNLTLGKKCVIVGYYYTGGLLGKAKDDDIVVIVDNCHTQATVAGKNNRIGGFAGGIAGKRCEFTDCTSAGSVYGGDGCGFAGYCQSYDRTVISRCKSSGNIYGAGKLDNEIGACGGLFGESYYGVTFRDCTVTNNIYSCYYPNGDYYLCIGGLAGINYEITLIMDGTNIVSPTFHFDDSITENTFVGGVFGIQYEYEGEKVEAKLREILSNGVDVSGVKGVPAGEHCGLYCGSPKIDTLD